MSLFSWQFFLSCWLQKMDVESFQLSVTDPIQPSHQNCFSPRLSSFNYESQTFQSLELKIIIRIGSAALTLLSLFLPRRWAAHTGSACGSSAPLAFHWHCLAQALTLTFFPFVFSLLPFFFSFFWHHCQFCLSLSHCPSKTSKRGTSVCFTFDSSHWAQPGTNHMLSDCCTELTICYYHTLLFQKFSRPQLLIKSRQAKGLDFNRLAPTSPFYCFQTYYALHRSSVFCKPASFILGPVPLLTCFLLPKRCFVLISSNRVVQSMSTADAPFFVSPAFSGVRYFFSS